MELLRDSIPERAQYILTWYGRKFNKMLQRPLTEEDYELREVGRPISEERWMEYWAKAGPNKAADAAGTHNNLFKSLKKMVRCEETGEDVAPASHVLDWFRRLLNVTLDTAHIYSDWAEEILCTLVKVPGSQDVNDTRPIGLVAILRNALEGIEFDRIQMTWEETQHLAGTQNGFRTAKGTDDGRLIATATSEDCYIYKKDAFVSNQDKKHAFDLMHRQGGAELGLLRLSVPRRTVRINSKNDQKGRLRVRTAHGLAKGVFRESGGVQGGRGSPAKWNANEDPFNTAWEERETGHMEVRASECMLIKVAGAAFADDKRFVQASFEQMDDLLRVSSDFTFFVGEEVRVSKSEYQIAVWTGRGNVLLNPAEVREQVGELGFYVGAEARKEVGKNSSIHINEGLLSLGEMSNAVGNWEPAMVAASAAAHQVACMMKKKMPNYMAYNLVHLILFRKCGYKIKFQSLSKQQTEDIVKPAMVEYKARLGLPRSTSTLAMQAMGLGDFWWETNVDRLLTMLKFLMGDDKMKAGLAMAGLYTEQMWGGGYCPVMETGFNV